MKTALLLLCLLQDDGLTKARKLIEESAAKLKACPAIAYEWETIQGEAGGTETRVPTKSKILIQAPNQARWEWTGSGGYDQLHLYDGKQAWFLDKAKSEYYGQPQYRGSLKNRYHEDVLMRLYLDSDPVKLLEKATDVAVSQRKEDGAAFEVIAWRGKDPYGRQWTVEHALWFDAAKLPRRYTQSWEWQGRLDMRAQDYAKIDLAAKPAADAFTFKPPDGAVEKDPRWATPLGIPDTEEAKQAQKLLIDIHKSFAAAEALSYETETSTHSDGAEPPPINKCVVTLKRPDFIRMEYSTGGTFSYSYIFDGEFQYTISPKGKNFRKQELNMPGHHMMSGVDPFVHVFFEWERPHVLQSCQDIGVAQEEFEKESFDIVKWSFQQPGYLMKHKFYVDSKRRPRMKTIESDYQGKNYKTTIKYKDLNTKPAIPKDHFTFAPGPDWTDRSNYRQDEAMIAAGKPAPDFETLDAAGATVPLSSFRGKLVVIVFGAYAHPSEIERTQGFHNEMSKRGVTVLAVATNPGAPLPDPKKHSVRFLRLKDTAVAKTYGVDYIPSGLYLLDADSKVLAATNSNDVLKKAVDEAAGPEK